MEEKDYKDKQWKGTVLAILLLFILPISVSLHCFTLASSVYLIILWFAALVHDDLHSLYKTYWERSQKYEHLLRVTENQLSKSTTDFCHAVALPYSKGSDRYFFFDEEKKILYSGGDGLDFQRFGVKEFSLNFEDYKRSNKNAITRWENLYTPLEIFEGKYYKDKYETERVCFCITRYELKQALKKIEQALSSTDVTSSVLVYIKDDNHRCYMRFEDFTLIYNSSTILNESYTLSYVKELDSFVFASTSIAEACRVMVRNIEPTLTNDEKKNAILIYEEI